MEHRVLKAFEEIKISGKDTVIITHGGVIAAIMAHYFKEENKNRYQWQPQPGHGYLLENLWVKGFTFTDAELPKHMLENIEYPNKSIIE